MSDVPPEDTLDIHFVGNATLLLRYGALTLLTDPNFLHRGQFAHLGYGLASRRVTEPAVPPSALPTEPDAVVLSHLHGDHWDRRARRHLHTGVPILTTPRAARRLQAVHGFHRAAGLRSWQSHDLVRDDTWVRVTAVPGRHARGVLQAVLPPVMGSVLEFGSRSGRGSADGGRTAVRLYISGDTLPFDDLWEIREAFPDVHLAVLHLGGTTLPGGFLVTMDAQLGADLVGMLDPPLVLPIHYEEYRVMRSPLADFLAEARRRGFGDRLVQCPRGARVQVGPGAHITT